jgi:conjugal transfer mating pair stabilization protein TraN
MDYISTAREAYNLGAMLTGVDPIAEVGTAMYTAVGTAVSTITEGAVALPALGGASIGESISTVVLNVADTAIIAVCEAGGMTTAAAMAVAETVLMAICSVLYVLMILYAIYKIISFLWSWMTACDDEDMRTSVKLTLKLCHLVGYTSEEVLGMDLKSQAVYCCFNSILARVIHEQGRPQIGRGWGTADSPDCAGLSTGELGQLDFDKIDLGEYMQYVQSNTKVSIADQEKAVKKAQDKVNALTQGK